MSPPAPSTPPVTPTSNTKSYIFKSSLYSAARDPRLPTHHDITRPKLDMRALQNHANGAVDLAIDYCVAPGFIPLSSNSKMHPDSTRSVRNATTAAADSAPLLPPQSAPISPLSLSTSSSYPFSASSFFPLSIDALATATTIFPADTAPQKRSMTGAHPDPYLPPNRPCSTPSSLKPSQRTTIPTSPSSRGKRKRALHKTLSLTEAMMPIDNEPHQVGKRDSISRKTPLYDIPRDKVAVSSMVLESFLSWNQDKLEEDPGPDDPISPLVEDPPQGNAEEDEGGG